MRKASYPKIQKTVKVKEIARVMLGNSAPQDLNLFENGKYPFVRVSDLAKEHISYNLIETRDYLNDEGIKKRTLFPEKHHFNPQKW